MTDTDTHLLRLRSLHHALGIPDDYIDSCPLPLCPEPDKLVATELDFYGRPQRLTPAALAAWRAMKSTAAKEGVTLFLISAYRGWDYQHDVIAGKLREGRSLESILKANAAPGFSEHHSGRAVDIGTPGCDALVEAFEKTDAFQWLEARAGEFAFIMSYPRDNPMGIGFEPWHWCFQPS